MVAYYRDARFGQRPHYKPEELDRECESIISGFLKGLHGAAHYPVRTDDLTKLIERDTTDLDLYADLSGYGPDVEGVTEFTPGQKPRVLISASLSQSPSQENRLRTTLTHEYGHVHFHSYLWDMDTGSGNLFPQHQTHANKGICKRDTILNAGQSDWMEWQAGHVCGALLMPKSVVVQRFHDFATRHKVSAPLWSTTPTGALWVNEVVTAFQVSSDAARIRSLKLGLLSESRPLATLL